jgi:hypothetical protein
MQSFALEEIYLLKNCFSCLPHKIMKVQVAAVSNLVWHGLQAGLLPSAAWSL